MLPKSNNNILRGLPYLSKAIIFFIDIVIVFVAFTIAYFISYNLQNTSVNFIPFWEKFIIVIITYTLFFYIFKTYSGIIRHSTLAESIRIFNAIICSNLLLIIINCGFKLFLGKSIYLNIGFIITGSLAFFLMYSFRLFTKLVYDYLLRSQGKIDKPKEPVLIWGISRTSLSIAKMIEANGYDQQLVGFICLDKNLQGKKLMNIPIFSNKDSLSKVIDIYKVKSIYISDAEIKSNLDDDFRNYCIDNNIKIIHIPCVNEWINSKKISSKQEQYNVEELLARPSIIIDSSVVEEQLIGSTILITGAAGSIGSEIVRQVLLTKPKLVIICDCAETPLHDIYLELSTKYSSFELEMCIANIRDRERLEILFSKHKPDYVYHAAAYKHVPMMEYAPSEAVLTNIMGTKNLVDLSVKYDVKKFVMISTDKVVNPTNVMGASKRIAEIYAQSIIENSNIKTQFVTTRFGNVLGSNGSVIPLFKSQIEKGGPVTVTHPDIIRYFMTIPEACRLVLEAGSMGKGAEIFIFDMGDPVKIVDLAERMISLAGYIPYEDIDIQFTGLRLGEKLYEELLNDKELVTKTHNKKIMIAKVRVYSFDEINIKIERLINLAKKYDDTNVVRLMKDIVPEFISKNSVYEELDTQKKLQNIIE